MTSSMAFVFFALVLAVLLTYLLHIALEQGVKKFHAENMALLIDRYPDVFKADTQYSFFTTGHPYVWVAIGYEEAVNTLMSSCKGTRGIPRAALYSIKIDEDSKCAYVVSGEKEFNFSNLMHYDEWLHANKQVATNIANYKAS